MPSRSPSPRRSRSRKRSPSPKQSRSPRRSRSRSRRKSRSRSRRDRSRSRGRRSRSRGRGGGKREGEVSRLTDRGFGFIRPRDGGPELFFHARNCRTTFDDFREGDRVEYEEGYDDRAGKSQAEQVQIV